MSMRKVLALATVCLGISAAAHATVTEPDGTVVPRDSANGETQVYTVLQQRDPMLNWQTDSDTRPETFSPLCSFSAELILKQSASVLGIGWYNVNMSSNSPPPYDQIYEIIAPGKPVGTKFTGQNIKDDPNYKGGLIGFALREGDSVSSHYSERRLNINCSKCTIPGPWITSVTYIAKSPSLPNTFFLGFEDGGLSDSSWSNDGDFNDYMFQFTGLTCSGGGQPCTVPGVSGICSVGVSECGITANTCKQVVQPESVEKCDGLDNDCNGKVDDGAMCDGGLICDRGHCVTSCSSEFPCAAGLTCDEGRCVNEDCTGVDCPGNQSCRGGVCVDPCQDIKCPGSQICRVGRCVDPCNGVSCGTGKACKAGACVPGCDCYPCTDAGTKCSAKTNLCVETACADVTCPDDQVCKAGACVNACDGATCPETQTCLMGQCYDIQGPNAGMVPDVTEGGGSVADGCSCRLSPANDTPGALAIGSALLVLSLTVLRRRRYSA